MMSFSVSVWLFCFFILSTTASRNESHVNANWMERALPIIGNRTLQQITLPGTHDSGSYYLTDELLEVPEFMDVIVQVADVLGLPVGKIIDGWSQSQQTDFYGQFLDGIRYLDIRIIWDLLDNVWKTHHGPVAGNKMEVLLQSVQQFVSQYSNEVLVLELSHADNHTKDQENILVGLIQQYLGKYLWPKSNGFVTLNQMISSGKNILLTLEFDGLPENIWSGDTIINSYANSPDLGTMENYNLAQIQSWEQHGNYPNKLYKMSWTLTPNTDTILEMILPGHPHTLLELADISNKDLQSWFDRAIKNKGYQYPIFGNILIIDDFGSSPIVEIVLNGLT